MKSHGICRHYFECFPFSNPKFYHRSLLPQIICFRGIQDLSERWLTVGGVGDDKGHLETERQCFHAQILGHNILLWNTFMFLRRGAFIFITPPNPLDLPLSGRKIHNNRTKILYHINPAMNPCLLLSPPYSLQFNRISTHVVSYVLQ